MIDKIILKDGVLLIKLTSKNLKSSIYSNIIFNEKHKAKEITLSYSNLNSIENYELNIDLIENIINLDEIDFIKKKGDFKIFLNFWLNKNKNTYEFKKFKIFNDKNVLFDLKNIILQKNFKINDFSSIESKIL